MDTSSEAKKNQVIFEIPNFNSTFLTTAKTKSEQAKEAELSWQSQGFFYMQERYYKSLPWFHQVPTNVADHTFAVLGYYNVSSKNTYVEFKIMNLITRVLLGKQRSKRQNIPLILI